MPLIAGWAGRLGTSVPVAEGNSEDDFPIEDSVLTGHDDRVGADTLRFAVEMAKIDWGTLFRDVMRGGSASSQFEDYSGRGPSVVAQNANGEK